MPRDSIKTREHDYWQIHRAKGSMKKGNFVNLLDSIFSWYPQAVIKKLEARKQKHKVRLLNPNHLVCLGAIKKLFEYQ